jgi:hypothetical protein
MPGSITRLVKTSNIAKHDMASVLVRLMMAINDMGIVNESLREWNTTEDKRRKARRGGARSFFVRMQMAYAFEALGIIKEIRDTPAFADQIKKCEAKTQECFATVCKFLDSRDYPLLVQVRNSAGFHYDVKRSERAVKGIAEEIPDDLQPQTLGQEPLDWYFRLGDKVQERIVVRIIFLVPKEADAAKESDAIGNRIFDMTEKLVEFAGYFVWEQTKA